LHTVNWSLIQQ
jgi:hypothetical protein